MGSDLLLLFVTEAPFNPLKVIALFDKVTWYFCFQERHGILQSLLLGPLPKRITFYI